MPNKSITLNDVHQSVTRPVVFDVIGQVQEISKITDKSKIFFPGDIQVMQTAGTDIDGSGQNRFPIFDVERICFIEVDENYNKEALNSTAVSREEHAPVFEDERLSVRICPVYVTSDVSINIRYRTPSKTEADRWLADMSMRISMMRDVNIHSVTYNYGIPAYYLELLEEIYDKREKVEPYGESLAQYVQSRMTERLTIVGDQVGKNIRLAVSETQCRIEGQFDIDGIPEKPTRDDANGTWNVSFTYKFSYEKPIACNASYPIMVHNQLLEPKFSYSNDRANDPYYQAKSFSKSLDAFHYFESDTQLSKAMKLDAFIRIPRYDDFIIRNQIGGTATTLLVLVEVGPDRRTLFNLRELGDVVLDQDILSFISEVEYSYICKQYLSLLTLSLYVDDRLQQNGSLICDENLNVKSTFDLNLRKRHHVRLGICVDMTLLPKSAIDRIRNYPKVLVKIISSINEALRTSEVFKNLGDKKQVTALEFSDLYYVLTGYGYNNGAVGRPSELYNSRPRTSPLLDSLDPITVRFYRDTMLTHKTVQFNELIVERK